MQYKFSSCNKNDIALNKMQYYYNVEGLRNFKHAKYVFYFCNIVMIVLPFKSVMLVELLFLCCCQTLW